MATKDLKMRVSVDGAEQAQSKLGMLGNTMKSMLGTVTLVAAGMMALRTTVKVFSQSVKEAENAEISLRKLNNVLISTGQNASWTTEELVKMAGNLQKFSNFGDDDIMQQATASLLRFTNIAKSEFPRVLQLVVDMGAETGNLEGAAKQLGLSMDDPILGMTRLRRAGVSLTEEVQNQIKSYVAAGKIQEAQKVLLGELEIKYKGNAAAMMSSTQVMKNAWGDYLETLGKSTKPALDAIRLSFANFFTNIANSQNSLVEKTKTQTRNMFIYWTEFTTGFILNAKVAFNFMAGSLKGMISAVGKAGKALSDFRGILSGDVSGGEFLRSTADAVAHIQRVFIPFVNNIVSARESIQNYGKDFVEITSSSLEQWDAMHGSVTNLTVDLEELGEKGAGGVAQITAEMQAAQEKLRGINRELSNYRRSANVNEFFAEWEQERSNLDALMQGIQDLRQANALGAEDSHRMLLEASETYYQKLFQLEHSGLAKLYDLQDEFTLDRVRSVEIANQKEWESIAKLHNQYSLFLTEQIRLAQELGDTDGVTALTQNLEAAAEAYRAIGLAAGEMQSINIMSAENEVWKERMGLILEAKGSYQEYYDTAAMVIDNEIQALRLLGVEEALLQKVQQARLDAVYKSYQDTLQPLEEVKDQYESLSGLIESSLSNAFYSLISNTQNFADGFKNIWKDLASSVLRYITQMLAKMAAMAIFQSILGGGSGLIGLTTGADPLNINGIVGSALGSLSTGNSPRYTPDLGTSQNDGQFNRLITRLENTINQRQPQEVVLRIGNREFRNAIQYSTIEANVM